MTFSARTAWRAEHNMLHQAVVAHRAAGRDLIDLTGANPTEEGLSSLSDRARAAMVSDAITRYRPEPFGWAEAREAVCGYYCDHGVRIDPSQVVLTASTSEAYGWVFKLLCDPGDRVVSVQPGYPLFDDLATMEGVTLTPLAMERHGRWELTPPARTATLPSAKAMLVVHPNNPTGHLVRRDEREALVAWAAEEGAALVVDEVFLDYPTGTARNASGSFASEDRVLTLTLSGLSKVAALPQVKLGWMVVSGPPAQREEALRRLEVLADSYLSVGASVQAAAATMLAERSVAQSRIRDRVNANRARLEALMVDTAITVERADAGWYAVLRLPRVMSDEAWCLHLLAGGVLVQPGYFFDFADEAVVVVSLLSAPSRFEEGVSRLIVGVATALDA